MILTTHNGPHWQVDLPGDWTRHEDRDGVPYFESADGRGGLYIALWNVHSTERDVDEVLQTFVNATSEGQDEIPGCTWTHRTVPLDPGDVLLESIEPSNGHRILTRFIALLPLVLRASFHDYEFTNVQDSNAFLGPSLQAVWLSHPG